MREVTLKEIPGLINLENLKNHYTLRADSVNKASQNGMGSTLAQIIARIPVVCNLYDGVPFGQGAAFFAKIAQKTGKIPKTKDAVHTEHQGASIEDILIAYGDYIIRVVDVSQDQAYLLDAEVSDLDKNAGKVVSESGGHSNANNLETQIREMEKKKTSSLFRGGMHRLDSAVMLALVQASQIDAYVAGVLASSASQQQAIMSVQQTVSAALKAGKQGEFEAAAVSIADYLTTESKLEGVTSEGHPHSAIVQINLSFRLGLSYMKQKADENWSVLFIQDGDGGGYCYKLEELIKRGKVNPLVMWLVYRFQSVDKAQALLYRAKNDLDRALHLAMIELINTPA